MAVKKENVRLWVVVHKDTKTTIEKLIPLLKAKSMGEVVERAITSYALAIVEYYGNQFKKEDSDKKEKNQDEIN